MSESSLWVLDENFNGFEFETYKNSWLFGPIVWDVLLDKYMHDEIQAPFGLKKNLMGIGGTERTIQLNSLINNCDNFPDRICWELSQHQILPTKNKEEVSRAISDFAAKNTDFHIDEEENKSFLLIEHIAERFKEVAASILTIDETQYPYFVFKNSSIDDQVQSWFEVDGEGEEDFKTLSLGDHEKVITEFVHIENGEIKGFTSNIDFFKSKNA